MLNWMKMLFSALFLSKHQASEVHTLAFAKMGNCTYTAWPFFEINVRGGFHLIE